MTATPTSAIAVVRIIIRYLLILLVLLLVLVTFPELAGCGSGQPGRRDFSACIQSVTEFL